MKLDVNVLRYLSRDEFRVLTAVEMGMKNHELVPAELVDRIAGLRHGGAYKNLRTLLRHKLVHHDSSCYDGYRLTNLGYDFLAIKTMANRGFIAGVGRQIGVGKESDIFEVVTEEGQTLALKLHRLGRTSFRAVKSKRDYLKHRNSYSWLYLSRLAALKEYAFMKALGDHGFPVPEAVDWNRHCVLMTLVPGFPLVQVKELNNPKLVFDTVLGLIVRLAEHGLIHCDFNEFNILIDEEEKVTMIDFPQMVSVSHRNAEMYFERDVECIFKFFGKRFNYSPPVQDEDDDGRPLFDFVANHAQSLDKELEASGFTRQNQEILEQFGAGKDNNDDELASDSESDDEDPDSEPTEEANVLTESTSGNGLPSLEQLKVSPGGLPGSGSRAQSAEAAHAEPLENARNKTGTSENEAATSAAEEVSSAEEGDAELQKRMKKHRQRSIAAIRGTKHSQASRNASKDKGGRRSRHVSSNGYEF